MTAEAWMIEDGKLTYPVKGATLIGNGPDVLCVSMIGNDMRLDGRWHLRQRRPKRTSGRRSGPLRIDGLTVGGTG